MSIFGIFFKLFSLPHLAITFSVVEMCRSVVNQLRSAKGSFQLLNWLQNYRKKLGAGGGGRPSSQRLLNP